MAKQQKNEVSFEDVLARRCGLDINKKEIVATVSGTDIKKEKHLKSGTMSLAKLSHAMFAQNPFHSAECLHCNILPICGGGCPIDREKYIGKDKRFCSIYKENLSELLPYFYTYKYSK